jgi:16S rRNA (cytosine967-C5)-methyltransferase
MADKPKSKSKRTTAPKSRKYDPVRAASVHAIGLALDKGWKADVAIDNVIGDSKLSELDRRFLLQLSHGVIKMKRRLDYIYSFFLQKPTIKLDKITRNILRLGLYQLIFTDRIPHGAAVSETVNLARGLVHQTRGAFVNAILRNYLRQPEKVVYPNPEEEPVEYLATYCSYPDWFVKYCIDEFGYGMTEKLLKRGNEAPRMTFRLNRLKYTPEQLESILKKHGVEYEKGKYREDYYHIKKAGLPLQEKLIDPGRIYIQDESAGLSVGLLDPRPRDHVIDLAAAPGGKATYSASLMKNQGLVTAVDINNNRLEVLFNNAQRLGIRIIAPVLCDILDFKGPGSNKVILDVPCSGWGVAAKNSDLRWSKTREDSTKLAETQARFLRHAASLVKPGGTLVYSTCTIIRDENDQVIEEFLLERRDFVIETGAKIYPSELISERGFVKTYPDIEGLDGSFCVRLKKKFGARRKKS